MIENTLFEKFEKLSNNDKRNVFNEEMIKIFEFLKTISINSEKINELSISNYNSNTEKSISEDEFLCKSYKNLINIRKALIEYTTNK